MTPPARGQRSIRLRRAEGVVPGALALFTPGRVICTLVIPPDPIDRNLEWNGTMRRRRAEKRQPTPDVHYNSELVARMINTVMERGKKSVAQGIVYGALDMISERVKDVEPLEVFLQALENVKPRLEVKSRRVGGATYQVPLEVAPGRQTAVAMRWICGFARSRRGVPMKAALAGELLDAYNNTGSAIKKLDDTHKMANANKAFAHYRW